MAANVIPGLGTVLQQQISGTYTTIGLRVNLKGPASEMDKAETTNLDSVTKTYRPTLADGGEVSGQIFYDPTDTTHQALRNLLSTKVITNFKLIYAVSAPNNTDTFSGFLTKFEPGGMEPTGNLTADFSIQINGLPVLS